jgi:hypothetical protein
MQAQPPAGFPSPLEGILVGASLAEARTRRNTMAVLGEIVVLE